MKAHHDEEENIVTYQARYVNQLDRSKKVSRNFGPGYLAEAYKWLDEERYYVTSFFAFYRKKNGTELCGRSKRIIKDALNKLTSHRLHIEHLFDYNRLIGISVSIELPQRRRRRSTWVHGTGHCQRSSQR